MFNTRILPVLFFLMPISASGIFQVTDSGSGTDLMGSWSPDGSKIVYSTHSNYYYSRWYLKIVPSTGGAPTTLYTNPNWDSYSPDWSPDGTKIALIMSNSPYHGLIGGNIYTIPANGSSSPVPICPDTALSPRWSPDGSKIAYCKYYEFDRSYTIYVIPSTGGTPELIASSEYGLLFFNPSWSPNGQKIVFQEGFDSSQTTLWVVDVASKIKNPLNIPKLINPRSPYWSRADNMIIFSAKYPGDDYNDDYDLFKVSEWGGNPIKINGYGTSDIHPASSFDSSRIGYTTNDGDIYTMNVHETKIEPTSIGQIKASYK